MSWLCLLACAACPTAASTQPRLAAALDAVLRRPELVTSTLGVLVARTDTGEILLEHNAGKLLAPASCTKLVSCAGALLALGKDFRFETRVVAAGTVAGGVLRGDLVLVASGDPNLSQRISPEGRLHFRDKDHSYAGFFDAELVPGDPLEVVRALARQVKDSGLRQVDGDIAADDGLFADTDDEFVGPLSAACVNDNLLDVTVSPGARPGDPARFDHQPEGSLVELVSTAVTAPEGQETELSLEPRDGAASFQLLGRISAGSPPVLRTAPFRSPAVAAAGFLADELRALGVRVQGRPKRLRLGPGAYADRKALATHVSPPLSEALRVVLKVSHNLHATMLPPLVGALKGGHGDRWTGYGVIARLFAEAGLDPAAVVIQSGSGGGRGDHLTPRWTVALLRHMASRPDFAVFFEALPVGGADGTLSQAFRAGEPGARVHAKTGTLVYRGGLSGRWVYVSKALSGYLDLRERPRGPPRPEDLLAFSIIIANTLAETRKEGSDALFRAQEDILRAALEDARLPAPLEGGR
ncbi:MAG: D-alanyl-D-alanine carboxypeptidase/D-alanyl-D-alanine-endopeptidase [Planctomycetes bacterium]|nr:D-alanyl-D-alanine carboxypeptidase/D-alanyl-D-alanine-endopeptidase [Planctomycetota bacterium]